MLCLFFPVGACWHITSHQITLESGLSCCHQTGLGLGLGQAFQERTPAITEYFLSGSERFQVHDLEACKPLWQVSKWATYNLTTVLTTSTETRKTDSIQEASDKWPFLKDFPIAQLVRIRALPSWTQPGRRDLTSSKCPAASPRRDAKQQVNGLAV